MMKILQKAFYLFLLLAAADAVAADDGGGIVYGPNHAVIVVAPHGWVLDNQSGVVDGVYAAIYPAGGSWKTSPAVMYVNCSEKNDANGHTLKSFIEGDTETFKKRHPDIQVRPLSSDEFHAGTTSSAFYFDEDQKKEAVVYVDAPKVVCMLVLSSNTQNDYDASLAPFKEFLASYKFLTSDVRQPGKKEAE